MSTLSDFDSVAAICSKSVTRQYSTSFYSAIRLLSPGIRKPICSIYGMVRLADEIVDTFHDFNKKDLLESFRLDTFKAIEDGVSLNPVLHSFQQTVRAYNISAELIDSFFESMKKDLYQQAYLNKKEYDEYIYGSAEVVGLMCLCVFCEGDAQLFNSLKTYAQALGAAFQKINFLRDLQSDIADLNRSYFPGFQSGYFQEEQKEKIEKDIENDFKLGYEGIKRLPLNSRFGVYVAYRYYMALFKKVRGLSSSAILQKRVRIPNHLKMVILFKASVRSQLNLI